MNLAEAIPSWRKTHPNYFVVAGDHRYGCACADCITFADDAAASSDIGDAWIEFLNKTNLDFNSLDIIQPYIPHEKINDYLMLLADI